MRLETSDIYPSSALEEARREPDWNEMRNRDIRAAHAQLFRWVALSVDPYLDPVHFCPKGEQGGRRPVRRQCQDLDFRRRETQEPRAGTVRRLDYVRAASLAVGRFDPEFVVVGPDLPAKTHGLRIENELLQCCRQRRRC